MEARATPTSDRLGGLRPQLVVPPALTSGVSLPKQPDHQALVAELKRIREKGLGALRQLPLPALAEATYTGGEAESLDYAQEPAPQEALLRKAVSRLGDGDAGQAAAKSFGLTPELRGKPSADRRKAAARVYGQDPDSFRNSNEKTVIAQLADTIQGLSHDQRMRITALNMAKRHPADSHLAVQWVERFEAYYRIYSPVTGLLGELEAARDTVLYARRRPRWWPDEESYDYREQAKGYVRDALYYYASFLLNLQRFKVSHGGMWLLPDQQQEYDLANAVYRIGWHNSLNQWDDSWLRTTLGKTEGQEILPFMRAVKDSKIGRRLMIEWDDLAAQCNCVTLPLVAGWALPEYPLGGDGPRLYTSGERQRISQVLVSSGADISADCQLHGTIRACAEYIRLVNTAWETIVDWCRVEAVRAYRDAPKYPDNEVSASYSDDPRS